MSDVNTTSATEPGYLVVMNDRGQYSIWEDSLPLPRGWQAEGFSGAKAACLAHIEEVWVTMRPLPARMTGWPWKI